MFFSVKFNYNSNLNFKIDVIGEGVLQQKLLKLIEYHKLNKYIELKGHISNPYENLIEADIMILPSLSEGISRASLEALFFGIPCLMRDVDGNRELIDSGVNGYLFKDLTNIEYKISEMYNLRNLNKNNNSILSEKFKYKNVKKNFLKVLNSLN